MADDDFHEWIALDDPRPLSGWERAISLRFLDYDFADKEIVRSQLEGVLVVEQCRADPTIQLSVPRDRPKLWKGDGELSGEPYPSPWRRRGHIPWATSTHWFMCVRA